MKNHELETQFYGTATKTTATFVTERKQKRGNTGKMENREDPGENMKEGT